jgi:hypothetical protein
VPCLPPVRLSQDWASSTQEEMCWASRLHWALPLRHAGVWPLIFEVRGPHPTLSRQARRPSNAGRHEELQAVYLFLIFICLIFYYVKFLLEAFISRLPAYRIKLIIIN